MSNADKIQRFCEVARTYEGTRWRHQGRLPGVGLDCAGLVVCAAREAGFEGIVDDGTYKRYPDGVSLVQTIRANPVKEVNGFDNAMPGDILVFTIERDPQHLGVLLENNTLVHAHAPSRGVVLHQIDKTWRDKITSIFRFI